MRFYLLVLFVFVFVSGNGQKKQDAIEHEFIGALNIPNQQVISYKIKFREIGNGQIEGESYTDLYGEDYTKSKITGVINSRKNRISFREVKNLSSSSTFGEESFCYVNVKELKIRSSAKSQVIQGRFNGLFADGDSCAVGSIHLVGSELLEKMKIDEDSLRRIDSIVQAKLSFPNLEFLKSNDNLSLDWKSNEIVFDVWDGSKEDDDRVSIYFNNELVEENLAIKNLKQTIKLPFKKGVLKVVALNQGTKGQNTVDFLLKDSGEVTHLRSVLNEREFVLIEFK